MGSEYGVPTTDDLDAMYEALKNWGRWGPDDQRGTLNHLTDARRAAAVGLVRTGESVSLSHDLATEPQPEHPHPVQHHMLASGDARDANGIPGYEAARDHLALDVHGLLTTHVDALSHMFVRGEMYGGRPASEVRSDGAAGQHGAVHGRRGDRPGGAPRRAAGPRVPLPRAAARWSRSRTSRWPSTPRASRVGPGDILLVAWGREARRGRHPGVRRLLRTPRRVPALAARAGGGGARERRDLRPHAVRGHAGVAVPRPPDRDHGHGPAPHRQRWPWPPSANGARRPADGSSCSPWRPLRIAKGTGCPVNPVAVL